MGQSLLKALYKFFKCHAKNFSPNALSAQRQCQTDREGESKRVRQEQREIKRERENSLAKCPFGLQLQPNGLCLKIVETPTLKNKNNAKKKKKQKKTGSRQKKERERERILQTTKLITYSVINKQFKQHLTQWRHLASALCKQHVICVIAFFQLNFHFVAERFSLVWHLFNLNAVCVCASVCLYLCTQKPHNLILLTKTATCPLTTTTTTARKTT